MADIIINGTTVRVSSGVVSSGLHVTSDGEVTVLDGGVVTDAEATSYGFFWVEEGGFLQNTFLHDSGEAFVSGGSAANLTMQSGGQANIMSGLFRSGTVLDGGVGVIYTTASGYDVAVSTGGRYLVYGGYAENTRVSSGGSFTIQLSGGLASDTTVEAGGTARIVSGAVASKNTLNGGRMEVLMGMADDVTILNGGRLKVHAAGEAQTITVSDGLLEVETGTVYDTFLSGGSADIRKGAAFRFNQFGGSADVMSGTVVTGGTLAGGVMTVWTGALLVDVAFDGGELAAQEGVVISRGIVSKGEFLTHSGVIYKEMLVNGGLLNAEIGADIAGTTVSDSGRMTVYDGAVVTGTTIGTDGAVTILNGGLASGIVASGLKDRFMVERMPTNVELDPYGGFLHVSSGGRAVDVRLRGGTVCVYDGGLISGVTMGSKGEGYDIEINGSAVHVNNDEYGGGTLCVESGGVARGVNLRGTLFYGEDAVFTNVYSSPPDVPAYSFVYIRAGGLLDDATLAATRMTVSGGGTVHDLTLTDYSLVSVEAGGRLTGELVFATGTTVNMMAGAILDIDISARTPGSAAPVTNLEAVAGTPDFTITVSADQAAGRYRLAENAHGFEGTLTVAGPTPETTGTITVDALAEIGGRYYMAKLKRDTLYLTIWDEPPDVHDDPQVAYVHPGWQSLEPGYVVDVPGGKATVGYDAYGSGDDALFEVANGGKVLVAGGDAMFADPIDGDVDVWWGATVTGATVTEYGTLTVTNGGTARDIYVAAGGTFTVEEGGILTGKLKFEDWTPAITINGTVLFDISGTTGNDEAFIDLYRTEGTPSYKVMLDPDQADGDYVLAYYPGFMQFIVTFCDTEGNVVGSTAGVVSRPIYQSNGRVDYYVRDHYDAIINGKKYSIQTKSNNMVLTIRSDTADIFLVDESPNGSLTRTKRFDSTPMTGYDFEVVMNRNAFTSLTTALAAGKGNEKIIITGGTYSAPVADRAIGQYWGGSIRGVTVNVSCDVYVGTASSLYISDGAALRVYENATLNGRCTFAATSDITIDGMLEFDLRDLTPETCTPQYDGLSYVKGSPDCLIRIGSTQAKGTYCLATNAAGFAYGFRFDIPVPVSGITSGTVVIGGGGEFVVSDITFNGGTIQSESLAASISIGGSTSTPNYYFVGDTVRYNGTAYRISEEGGALYLTISDYEVPEAVYVNTEWESLRYGSLVTLPNGEQGELGLNAFGTLSQAYPAVTETGTVYLAAGSYTIDEMSAYKLRKTVALSGTTITGYYSSPYSGSTLDLTLASGAVGCDIELNNNATIMVEAGGVLNGTNLTTNGIFVLKQGAVLNGSVAVSNKRSSDPTGMIVLDDVTDIGKGTIVVAKGGTLSGSAVFNGDMDITVNGWLDFNIAGTTAGCGPFFKGLYTLLGRPDYCVTVSNTQEKGLYRLGDDITGFGGSLTLKNQSGAEIGTLEIGKTVQLAGTYYTLRGLPENNSYYLYLVVGEQKPPEAIYLNTRWSNLDFGAAVTISGLPDGSTTKAFYRYDAFASVAEARGAIVPGGTVTILGGSFSFADSHDIMDATFVVSGGTLGIAAGGSKLSGSITVTNKGRLDLERGMNIKPASITVDATSTIAGSYTFGEGMDVTVNGTFFTDISRTAAGETACFEGLSNVKGAPSVYVLLSETQADGRYVIASEAAQIGSVTFRLGNKKVISLQNGIYTESYANEFTVDVNGSSVRYGRQFTVSAVRDDSGDLVLEVRGYEKPKTVYVDTRTDAPHRYRYLKDGTVVTTVDGGTAVVGESAFAYVDSAFDNLAEDGTLVVENASVDKYLSGDSHYKLVFYEGELKSSLYGTTVTVAADSSMKCGNTYFYSGSVLTAEAGATVTGTAGFYSGSVFTVEAGATLKGTATFYSGSVLTVEAGATLNGNVKFHDGATITINGTLVIDSTNMSALYSGLGYVRGDATYLLVVGDWLMLGDHLLADDSAGFNGVFTVTNSTGEDMGTLAVGESLVVGRNVYTLNLDDAGKLYLNCSEYTVPEVYLNSEWTGLEAGTVVEVGGTTATIGYDAFASYANVKAKYRTVPKMFISGGTVSFNNEAAPNLTTVRAGAILADATVNGYSLTLENGATARNITVSGNIFTLENGALAQDVRVSGGTVLMENGAIAAGIIVTNGLLQVENASAQNVSVTGGVFAAAGGTSVIGLTVSGGTVALGGASVVGLTFYGGKLTLADGASIRDLTVSLAMPMPGYLTFNSVAGAVLSGTITVGSQTKLTGGATFADDAVITIDGVLEFDISGMTASGSALYNRMSAIRGDTTFRVAVSASQTAGDYVLASGAEDFAGVISVVRDGFASLGTLWVGGTLVADNMQYTLTRDDLGQLHLVCKEHITRPVVYVNSLWSSLEEGTIVPINGQTATLGYDAFADGASALDYLGSTSKLNITGGSTSFNFETVACDTDVWDGAFLTGIRISDATLTLSGDASAWSVTVGVVLYKSDGSISLVTGGTLLMKSGSSAQDLMVNAGTVTLESDVFIWNFRAGLETDQKVAGVTINSTSDVILSGTVTLGSTAKLTGGATFDYDAVITVNGVLDFDISGNAAGGGALYRGLSMVRGTPRFTLTVNGEQGYGKYALADGVTEFDSVITVVTKAGETFGTLSVGSTLFLGNTAYTLAVNDGVLSVEIVEAEHFAKSDVDGNNVSDVLFQYTGGDNQTGYWLNGKDEWRGNNAPHPADWKLIGAYDMDGDGRADAVFAGYGVEVGGKKGAYIGYYKGGVDTDDNWVTIDFLENEANHTWHNAVGNLTGNAGRNSIVWYAPELYALGVWTDGTSEWTSLSGDFGGDAWTLVGCGDFTGEGKDSVLMSYNGGQIFYAVGFDGSMTTLGSLNWSGWEVRAIGDFAGDGKDDIVLFHAELGAMVMLADGNADDYTSIGQLDPTDWFVVGCGDYNGDQKDDLLVRQYSTGMLGYYSSGDTTQWNTLGYGVDMSWTVIA